MTRADLGHIMLKKLSRIICKEPKQRRSLYEYKHTFPPHCQTIEFKHLHPFIHSTNIHWHFQCASSRQLRMEVGGVAAFEGCSSTLEII